MNIDQIVGTTTTVMTELGLKILGAVALWVGGRWLIGLARKLLSGALTRNQIDVTVSRYIEGSVAFLLNIALIVSILGFFGVETTTFAALLAAGGVAIGLAWGGLLANFAAGVFLMLLRPFRVGDAVTVAGVSGTVYEIGLFGTSINTADNVLTIVGNNKIFNETIQNFSANPYDQGSVHRSRIPGAGGPGSGPRAGRPSVKQRSGSGLTPMRHRRADARVRHRAGIFQRDRQRSNSR
jgi:small conductance mechanosensitive channel